jgi:methylenetetrahydrofolate dehydrogenase (NADP+) / methenyltetrahydrofolate cyclohydrolase
MEPFSAATPRSESLGTGRVSPPAKLIDGRAAAARLSVQLAYRIESLRHRYGVTPALAVIRVGDDPASAIHVSDKLTACAAAGVKSVSVELPDTMATSELVDVVGRFNADPAIHGVVVQLPLPGNVDVRRVVESISLEKDVDGLVGDMGFPQCLPYGVLKLLESEGVAIKGENVVVVGASSIVGKPMGLMLLEQGATVSICEANARDLAQYTIIADILIVAACRPRLIVPSMVKTGAVVIDVGTNRLTDGSIIGDVEFDGVSAKASRITPVPEGVGPMTVAMLLENTVVAAERSSAGVKPQPRISRSA